MASSSAMTRRSFRSGKARLARSLSARRAAIGLHDTFDRIVVCAGVKSREFAGMLGDHVNIYPVKGYSITVCLDDERSQSAAPWVSLLDDNAKIVTSRLGVDRFRVAGTAEINGFNRDIRADRVAPLVEWTRRLFPQVSTARVIPWAGLRPMMPSMLPRVGQGKRAGVFYNTGMGISDGPCPRQPPSRSPIRSCMALPVARRAVRASPCPHRRARDGLGDVVPRSAGSPAL